MSLTIRGRPIRFSLKWLKPPPLPPDGSMTLFEHLRELRYRLVVAVAAILVGMIASAFFYKTLYSVLLLPYRVARADLIAKHPGVDLTIVQMDVAAPFTMALKVCMIGGLVITAPVWLYQIWSFVVPGLLSKEKKWTLIFIAAASPLFAAGVALGYVVMPKGISVLLGFTPADSEVANMLNLANFLSFLIRVMIVFGIAFLIPVFVLMLNFLGVIKASQLRKYRVYVIFGTFVFGAVATPSTDPFSMLALAVPMTVLFMVSEIIAHIADRRKATRAAMAGDELVMASSTDDDVALKQLSEGEQASEDEDEPKINGSPAKTNADTEPKQSIGQFLGLGKKKNE